MCWILRTTRWERRFYALIDNFRNTGWIHWTLPPRMILENIRSKPMHVLHLPFFHCLMACRMCTDWTGFFMCGVWEHLSQPHLYYLTKNVALDHLVHLCTFTSYFFNKRFGLSFLATILSKIKTKLLLFFSVNRRTWIRDLSLTFPPPYYPTHQD